jgi:hypothetical protein
MNRNNILLIAVAVAAFLGAAVLGSGIDLSQPIVELARH